LLSEDNASDLPDVVIATAYLPDYSAPASRLGFSDELTFLSFFPIVLRQVPVFDLCTGIVMTPAKAVTWSFVETRLASLQD